MKVMLRKVKFNKGVMDGRPYDYTRIYIEVPVYEKQEKEFGVDVLELEFGDESDHVKLEHLRGKLPILVDLDYMPVKKGNDDIKLVTRFEVIGDAKPVPTKAQLNKV